MANSRKCALCGAWRNTNDSSDSTDSPDSPGYSCTAGWQRSINDSQESVGRLGSLTLPLERRWGP
jgi:hypothetical protein